MKKISKILILVLIAVLSITVFVACTPDTPEPSTKSVVLYIVDRDNTELASYERTTDLNTVTELFLSLVDDEGSTFGFDSSVSSFGQFVNSITVSMDTSTFESTGLFPGASEFCAFYHTIDDVKYTDLTMPKKSYNELEFFFAGTGINHTPLVDGASYLFTISGF